jgi:PAS domain S-box-containing protein
MTEPQKPGPAGQNADARPDDMATDAAATASAPPGIEPGSAGTEPGSGDYASALEQQRTAEARYRRLFETARDGILILDAASTEILDVNPHLEQLLGYSRSEIVGRSASEFDSRAAAHLGPCLERVGAEGVVHLDELPLCTRDGRSLLAEAVANAYIEEGRALVQINLRDITERKKFQDQLLHTQKLESLGLLAGGIAHDFNNLLTGILGNASLASVNPSLDASARACVREVMRAAERAAFLTGQMLAYAGKGRFLVRRLDIGEQIREISALARTSIPKTVELVLDIGSHLPPVEADAGQMHQLVMNLVINGAEAVGDIRGGTVIIRAAAREVSREELSGSYSAPGLSAGVYVEIGVSDNGSGMDEETRARMFDPFFTTKFTGRGLGLAAVMGIVTGHGGAIRVWSSPGRGSKFEVLLPAAAEADMAEAPAPVMHRVPEGVTVLLIDDEEIVRNVAIAVLEQAGFHVLTAGNGRAGLDVFKRHGAQISLVILDLLMPEMGGEETLARLHAIAPDMPVILSSGFDAVEARRRFEGSKLAGFIQKPYDIHGLVTSICEVLAVPR